jgi:hypothetical protein
MRAPRPYRGDPGLVSSSPASSQVVRGERSIGQAVVELGARVPAPPVVGDGQPADLAGVSRS